MTAPEKGRWYWAKNWLHYHWVYLVIAAVVLWVGISWLANALHWGETLPDYQIAYVGKNSLPEDTARAIESAFAQYGEDLNGDGAVCVRLNQYVSDTEDKENASTYALAAQMQFLSDMNAEDSYFLLLDDPAHFQLDYQALANWDGTPPGDSDYTAAGKTVCWADCPALAEADLGTYQTTVLGTTVTGENAELVENLYLGRRAFYEDAKAEKAARAREGAERLGGERAEPDERSNPMKRNGLFVLVLALAAVLCTGCGVKDEDLKSDPLVNADGTAPVGSTLVAPAPQDDFVLLDNKDILAANGLYYASWVSGEPQPYENSEGKTVDLYDAQLTLVVQENKTEDKAASAVEGWQTLAQQNYDISNTQTLTAAGQEYTVIQFTYQDESNPYASGVAAFAQRGTSAIEWELSCQDSYSGDALKVLTDFLNSCTY